MHFNYRLADRKMASNSYVFNIQCRPFVSNTSFKFNSSLSVKLHFIFLLIFIGPLLAHFQSAAKLSVKLWNANLYIYILYTRMLAIPIDCISMKRIE